MADLQQLMHLTIARIIASTDGQIKQGDSIASRLPNGLAWILVDLAAQWMGWIHVALDVRLPLTRRSNSFNSVKRDWCGTGG